MLLRLKHLHHIGIHPGAETLKLFRQKMSKILISVQGEAGKPELILSPRIPCTAKCYGVLSPPISWFHTEWLHPPGGVAGHRGSPALGVSWWKAGGCQTKCAVCKQHLHHFLPLWDTIHTNPNITFTQSIHLGRNMAHRLCCSFWVCLVFSKGRTKRLFGFKNVLETTNEKLHDKCTALITSLKGMR